MTLPFMLPPLEPSALVGGSLPAAGGGFAARLLACLDADVDASVAATAAQPTEHGDDAPLLALLTSLTVPAQTADPVALDDVAADGEIAASADGVEHADGDLDADTDPEIAMDGGSTASATAGLALAVAQEPHAAATDGSQASGTGQAEPLVVEEASSAADADPAVRPDASTPVENAVEEPTIVEDAPSDVSAPDTRVAEERSGTQAAAAAAADGTPRPAGTAGPASDADPQGAPAMAGTAAGGRVARGGEPTGVPAERNGATTTAAPDADTMPEVAPPSARPTAPPQTGAASTDRPEGERPTAQPASVPVDPAATGEGDLTAPPTQNAPVAGSTRDTSAPEAPTVARIVELVERLRTEPPPRQVVIDLDEFGVGKLVVSLRADTVVVEPLDADARLDPRWREDLGEALDERGWSFDAEGQSPREQRRGSPAPAADAPTTGRSTRASQPNDGHLRL